MTEPLDPLRLPLRGSVLIEASAGTGKTWTLAALVLRLVLGHGEVVRHPDGRPLMPRDVLVMTFTRAATRELNERIRARLAQAAACFRGLAEPRADDGLLRALMDAVGEGAPREAAAFVLAQAAESMDEAAIHTLDAWCQRMLREHAVDGLGSQPAEVLPDAQELLAEAAHDWWRQQVYPLSPAAWAAVAGVWPRVDELVTDMAAQGEALRAPAEDAADDTAEASPSLDARIGPALAELAALKDGWPARIARLEAWFAEALAADALSRSKVKPSSLAGWMAALRDWAAQPGLCVPALARTGRQRLTASGLQDAFKKGVARALPPEIHALETLLDTLDARPSWAARLRPVAVAGIGARLQQLKAQRGLASHLDLQRRLDAALDEERRGEAARQLRARIVAQFPVALVDEFQDTSPLQLRILDRLYGVAANDPARALVLIGDPKQSIYGFRGADIHSYLRARAATAGRHYALDTNYRSTPGVVGVVNALFGGAEARPGPGAFGLGDVAGAPGDAPERQLPFEPVAARGLDERLVGQAPLLAAPMTLHRLDGERGIVEGREAAAQACARAIVELLSDAQAACVPADGTPRPLRAGDLSVLVRSRTEAALVRRALDRRQVPSVFLSDQDSVYATEEAADVLRLLRAMAQPRDPACVRAAMSSALIALSADALVALADDETRLDDAMARFLELHTLWLTQGLLAALRRALHAFALPARWLAQPQGERRLTNVLHLAELLQREQARLSGPAALVRHLAAQLQAVDEGLAAGDEALVRLESDADRVQVVTIHKSKGLEYPVVFLPFVSQVRQARRSRYGRLRAEGDSLREAHDEERLADDAASAAEELRLLYVALTRARHALWVGVATLLPRPGAAQNLWHQSAFGRLVSGTEPRSAVQAVQDLEAWAAAQPGLRLVVEPLPDAAGAVSALQRLEPRQAATPLLPAPAYRAGFDRLWGIASYSALVRDLGAARPAGAAATPSSGAGGAVAGDETLLPLPAVSSERRWRDDEPEQDDAPSAAAFAAAQPMPPTADPPTPFSAERPTPLTAAPHPPPAAAQPWHRFPRGAWAGTFLHGLLEQLAHERFVLADHPEREAALRRRCERQGWGLHADTVVAWLGRVGATPLPALGVPLGGVDRVLPEMEFWLPADGLDAGRLDAACREQLWPGEPRPPLPERRLHGLLMGFADLVVEHQGRFWVLDHKSNALGTDDAHYPPDALAAAMREHRYDVQAVLYLLALHRLLRSRFGSSYEPRRQLGGALYLFLRGIDAPGAGCCTLAPPWPLIEALDAALDAATPPEIGR